MLGEAEVAKESEYRGRTIRATSYQNKVGNWIPRAEIVVTDSRGTQQHSVSSTKEYRTQAEADAEAVLLAQRWIDSESSAR
jgi:hypothetical protein